MVKSQDSLYLKWPIENEYIDILLPTLPLPYTCPYLARGRPFSASSNRDLGISSTPSNPPGRGVGSVAAVLPLTLTKWGRVSRDNFVNSGKRGGGIRG